MAEYPNDDDMKSIRTAFKLLTAFREISPTMPISLATTFLTVAMNEHSSLTDLNRHLDLKTSTLSRHLLDLGVRNRKMTEGLGLIDCRQDPMELRKNQYTLTPKGRTLLRKVLKLIEKD
ncbi:MarR family winged helix-turn-helix transcriptional regulator [Parvibaculum sp.]|uniref:MarR family winged helix-turn-helix transcriptional regulator n=1 Tax=Parvibaculum sp. TaxID=2024848 RepID=UPI00320C99A2